jgi:predicted AlkP superfamily pyrophosphatase or phosphodiesterase
MRRAALLSLLAVLGGLIAVGHKRPAKAAPPADKPRVKLAVLVVFDQMRGDFLDKWQPLFGEGGFARLQDDGAWFAACYYPYGTTTTGPGHASMLTGTCPDKHGITNNNWYDRSAAADVYCTGSTRYQAVPAVPRAAEEPKDDKPDAKADEKKTTTTARPKASGHPDRLLSETVADVLKRVHGDRAKVFGLSLKDRSAILPTGKRPDGAYWFDGRFGTSTYYADRVHPWVEAFNRSKPGDRWLGKEWTRFRPDLDYAKYSGPDDSPGEGKGISAKDGKTLLWQQGKTFPHATGKDKVNKAYYDAVATSPFGNDLLLEFAKACVTAEELGRHDASDLLVVSFSSNDLVGHAWGPDSQEVLDVTLRSDALMAELLSFLDAQVGKGNYVLAVTADHGICPLPEVSAAKGLDAKRIDSRPLLIGAEKHLHAAFGPADQPAPKADAKGDPPKGKAAWVESTLLPWLYLNPRFVKASGKSTAEVARSLADYLAKQDGIAKAFTREELAAGFPESDAIGRRVARSYHPDRSGDVYVLLKPYHLFGRPLDTGTGHGTPYDYDRHVPLLVYGPGIPGGRRSEPVTPQAAAAIFARFLGVPPPKDAEFPVPATLEKP